MAADWPWSQPPRRTENLHHAQSVQTAALLKLPTDTGALLIRGIAEVDAKELLAGHAAILDPQMVTPSTGEGG